MTVDEAIILVGGRGTRLQAVISDVPKPLAPVAGRPFLAWVLDHLAASGIRRALLATGYLSGQIEAAVGDRWQDMQVDYSIEDAPLGTGGAVRQAAQRLQGDAVHVLNGDTFLRYAPAALEAAARAAELPTAVALAHVDDVSRYGAVVVEGGKIARFEEKGGRGAGLINAGSYFLDAEALASLPATGAFSLETAFLAPQAAAGRVAAFSATRDFIDIGVPDDYARAQTLFAGEACDRRFLDPAAADLIAAHSAPRRALFLDRDGVVNADHGYVHTVEGTAFLPGIFDLCRAAYAAGLLPIVVTNQAGIARGLYDEAAFIAYTRWLHAEFAARGAPLLATHYCPHHPQADRGEYRVACASRKPNPGMVLHAAADYHLDLAQSLLIGDKQSDLAAARAAGIAHVFFVGDAGLKGATDWLQRMTSTESGSA